MYSNETIAERLKLTVVLLFYIVSQTRLEMELALQESNFRLRVR